MKVFKIPDALENKYHGAGHAVAAVVNDSIVDFVYFADILPDYDHENGSYELKRAIDDERLGPTIRYLQTLGEVYVGMGSCWEFVVL